MVSVTGVKVHEKMNEQLCKTETCSQFTHTVTG